jgi:hypothetical protein
MTLRGGQQLGHSIAYARIDAELCDNPTRPVDCRRRFPDRYRELAPGEEMSAQMLLGGRMMKVDIRGPEDLSSGNFSMRLMVDDGASADLMEAIQVQQASVDISTFPVR